MAKVSIMQNEFYQKLGKLFYAIAASDRRVHKFEFEALRNLVIEEWQELDEYEDHFHSDAAYQIEAAFDWYKYQSKDAAECFNTFKEYYLGNLELFNPKRKYLIIKTANEIAAAFAEKNKNELIMLSKLKLLLFEE